MSSEIQRLKKRKDARKRLEKVFSDKDRVIITHYSCESFYDVKGEKSTRICSIACKFLETEEVVSFSVHRFAEEQGVAIEDLPGCYENIEKLMLQAFFEFVREHSSYLWAHWNMRNDNFGFAALEHRARVLGLQPTILKSSRKVDLSRVLNDIYGHEYAEKPVLVNLCVMNDMESDRFLSGAEEAKLFDEGLYHRLHQSTQKKVDFIGYIAELSYFKRLKTNASFFTQYGVHPKVLVDLVRDSWIAQLFVLIGVPLGLVRFAFWAFT